MTRKRKEYLHFRIIPSTSRLSLTMETFMLDLNLKITLTEFFVTRCFGAIFLLDQDTSNPHHLS